MLRILVKEHVNEDTEFTVAGPFDKGHNASIFYCGVRGFVPVYHRIDDQVKILTG
ncbi:MAG: hypothetical protein JST50_02635 [Bacteroidetes bacterium]|nr:hypothetical protein [Bacteroidota bacterium]